MEKQKALTFVADHKKFQLGIKGLIKNKEGQILLLFKSFTDSQKFGRQPDWDFPGGRIEEGSSMEATLKREIKQETGIKNFKNKGFFYAVVSNYWFKDLDCGLILFIYEIVPTGKFKIKLNNEHIKFGWFDKNKAAKLLSVKYPADFTKKIRG
jgi:8-oxo-dGTP pyrophosphatase MutT (NUDIX family)